MRRVGASARGTAAALALATAACQQLLSAGPAGRPETFAVGSNAIGESCSVVSGGQTEDRGARIVHRVLCGAWEQPSASIVELTGARGPANAERESRWHEALDADAVCAEPKPTRILGDVPATALDCTLREGGWPYQALLVRLDDETFLAEGVPVALAAVEQAIGVLTGRREPSADARTGPQSPELARLQARIAAARYSMGDLGAYRQLLLRAQADNFAGRHAQAEARYREALELQQRSGLATGGGEAFVTMHLAVEVSNQERFDEADTLFARSESLFDRTLDPSLESLLLSYRAIHEANQKQLGRAVELARRATDERLALAGIDPREGEAGIAAAFSTAAGADDSTDLGLPYSRSRVLADVVQSKYIEGAALVEEGKFDEAGDVLDEAARIAVQDPRVPRHRLAKIRLKQAEIAERQGADGRAESALMAALASQREIAVASRDEGLAWLALGRVRARAGSVDSAMQAFRNGFDILAQDTAPLRYAEIEAYADLVLAQAKKRPAERATLVAELFDVAQLVRTPVVSQSIAMLTARLASGNEAAGRAIRALEDARRRRDALGQALASAESERGVVPVDTSALEKQLAEVSTRIEGLEREVQAAAPGYNRLIERPASLDSVRAALGPQEALTQIVLGTDRSLAFFVDRDGVEAYGVDFGEAEARDMVARLRAPFVAGGPTIGRFDVATANRLYQRLFQPVAERLRRARQLVVVPSGPLLGLPYGLLVTEPPDQPDQPDYTRVSWLATKSAIGVSPSVQSFVGLRERIEPSRARQPLVGYGAFVVNRDVAGILASERLPAGLPGVCRARMAAIVGAQALPGTEHELRAVATVLGAPDTALRLGDAFSEAAVRSTDLRDYRVVYFATHGYLPHEVRECWSVPALAEPGLIASRPGAGTGPDDDGILLSSEIAGLALDADLVVLSACDTGGPDGRSNGESLSGLSRVFFYSGARSLLVTHWAIADEATVGLMTSTFAAMKKGVGSTAEALSEGQRALIADRRTAHPLFWAAFVLIGGGPPSDASPPPMASPPTAGAPPASVATGGVATGSAPAVETGASTPIRIEG